jgi:CopG antitoxin of type II toxin-antitoxin system
MTKQHKKDPIPHNASREELAKFWDTHDFTDYLDELKPIKVKFAKKLSEEKLSEGVTVRLDAETLEKLETQAKKKRLGTTTLIRMWLLEHLEEQEEKEKQEKDQNQFHATP